MKENKALIMKPRLEYDKEKHQKEFDYTMTISEKPEVIEKFKIGTVKGSQFKKPLLEYSGACAGCGETPYAKLVTQLFGERMYIANATGCTSIWANSTPSTAYSAYPDGRGPAWSNSLFEDAAEFGYGIYLAENIKEQERCRNAKEVSAGKRFNDNEDDNKKLGYNNIEKENAVSKKKSVWIFRRRWMGI